MIDDKIAKARGWEMNEVTDDKWQCRRDDEVWEQTEERKHAGKLKFELIYPLRRKKKPKTAVFHPRSKPRSPARSKSPLRKAF